MGVEIDRTSPTTARTPHTKTHMLMSLRRSVTHIIFKANREEKQPTQSCFQKSKGIESRRSCKKRNRSTSSEASSTIIAHSKTALKFRTMSPPASPIDSPVPQFLDGGASAARSMTGHEDGQFDDCDDDIIAEKPSQLYLKGERNNRGTGEDRIPTPVPASNVGALSSEIAKSPPKIPSVAESREENETTGDNYQVNHNGITKLDVLSGRGGGTNNHAGNRYFRQLCDQRRHVYVMSKKMQKKDIAVEIVAEIRARGGRFLKRNDATGEWDDIGEQKAISKTSQALREGLAQKMRQALVSSGTAEEMRLAASAQHNSDSWQRSAACSAGRESHYTGYPSYGPYMGTDQGFRSERTVTPDRVRKRPFSHYDAYKRPRPNF
uniref:DUF6824 domain-containing protein n=1 Tax=Pseudictyota dubia TaxID=2749911 RepID=A0A7R9ZC61_9STRA|mmetsp:Transcript_35801/g.65915  ORF Transcript_35801/g.65915 Transcript_35801/m.65915 type:complete len:379 (+) Transcript_35801:49-1185(+)